MPEEYENVVESAQEMVREHHRQAGQRPNWMNGLALTTALFAVFAAIASLKAGDTANEALYRSNLAVLSQAKASDTWNEFQADSLKKYLQTGNSLTFKLLKAPSEMVASAQLEASRRQNKQNQLKAEAQKHDKETATLLAESSALLGQHSRYALGVALLQVAIGLSAIAALLRLPTVWWLGLLSGASAVVMVIRGLLGV